MNTALQKVVLRFAPLDGGPLAVRHERVAGDLLQYLSHSIYSRLPIYAYRDGGQRAKSVSTYFALASDSQKQIHDFGCQLKKALRYVALAGVNWRCKGPSHEYRTDLADLSKLVPSVHVGLIPTLPTEQRLSSGLEDVRRFFVNGSWSASRRSAEGILEALETGTRARLIGRLEFLDPTSAILAYQFRRTSAIERHHILLRGGGWKHPVEEPPEECEREATGYELVNLRPFRSWTPHRVSKMLEQTPAFIRSRIDLYTGHAVRKATQVLKRGRREPEMSEEVVYEPISFAVLDRSIVLASWTDGHHGSLMRMLGMR